MYLLKFLVSMNAYLLRLEICYNNFLDKRNFIENFDTRRQSNTSSRTQ